VRGRTPKAGIGAVQVVPSEPGRTRSVLKTFAVIPVAETRPRRRPAFALPSGCL